MRTVPIRRTALAVAAGVIVAGAVAASGAQAATIHACVKPRSGATRIVGARAKCRHGEQKLSWNTNGPQGPAGKNGVPGAEGKAGPSGLGPAFFAGAEGLSPLTEAPTVIFTKTVPPGDYVINAPVLVRAEATTAKFVDANCFVVEKPGTTLTAGDLTSEELVLVAFGVWEDGLGPKGATEFQSATTITLAGTLESKVTSTLGVICGDSDTTAGVTVNVEIAELVATQVSSIS
jgi:hypothetical protein